MKKNYLILLFTIFSAGFLFAQTPNAGTFDATFGTNGIVLTPVHNNGYTNVSDVTVQPDGKALVTGYSKEIGDNYEMFLVRYNTDGTLDTSFANGGIYKTQQTTLNYYGMSVKVLEDGKIIVGGRLYDSPNSDEVVWKFNADGTLDSTFGVGGMVTTDLTSQQNLAETMLIQPDGKIVTGGYVSDRFALFRYNTNGTIDTSFGTGGHSIIEYLHPSYLKSIALQEDGKIVATGMSFSDINYISTIARFNADGSLDASFGDAGVKTIPFGNGHDFSVSVNILENGNMLIAGHTWIENIPQLQYDLMVFQLNPDGEVVTTFGNNGFATLKISPYENYLFDSVVQSDGKILLTGYTDSPDKVDGFVARFTSEGALDTAFGESEGFTIIDVEGGIENFNGVALDENGNIYVAGKLSDEYNPRLVLARFVNDISTNVESIETAQNQLQVYPNPATDFINVNPASDKVCDIEIVNTVGQVVYRAKIEGATQISVSNLNEGVYFVRSNDGVKTATQKIIVRK